MHAGPVFRRGQLIFRLIVFLVDHVKLGDRNRPELCPALGNLVTNRNIVADVHQSREHNDAGERIEQDLPQPYRPRFHKQKMRLCYTNRLCH